MSDATSQERTRNYISQIKGSVVFKGLAVAVSFFSIPLMIRYLGQEQFGVWSTLLSIMSWIVFFDLGIGNGLRNKLAESLAKNKIVEAAHFISSGYSLIGLLSLASFFLMTIATIFIPWQKVFNTHIVTEATLRDTVLVASFFICLNFWISLINQVLNAIQKTSLVVLGQLISNVIALVFVVILTRITDASLLYLATTYGLSMIASNLLLSFWFYQQRRDLVPKPSLEIQHIRPLLSLGLQFFTIQVAALVIFTTDKMLITQLFDPQSVTQYDVVFKLFSIITLVYSLISAPLWSSYTDAYHRQDFAWIKQTLHKQLIFFGLIILAVMIFILMAKPIIALWIGYDLEVLMPTVISIGVFILISIWNNIFAFFVNGIGKIKIQLFTAIIAMLINIPLAIFLVKFFEFGVSGIVWSTCISLSIFAFIGPIQVFTILNTNKA